MASRPDPAGADDGSRRREDRLRAVLETAVDAVITIDRAGLVESFNPAAERMFGYAAAEVVGRNVRLLMPEPYQSRHDEYIARYLATGERKIIGIGREVVGRRKDGTTFPIDLAVGEAATPDGPFFTGIIRDLTDRKRTEEELRRSNARLEEALRALEGKNEEIRAMTQQLWQAAKLAAVGELAASIAHEVNNPLATVALRVESLLAQTPPDDPRRRLLEVVDQEVERMGNLVANLLQFSRRGRQRASTLDVRDELLGTLELVRHQFHTRRITLAQELAPVLPAVHADRQHLRQVFLNLFTNALDAMPQGGTLTLRAAAAPAAVTVEVADTGVGIAPEHLPRVMEPFFTTKDEGKGTGLGLAVCRRIVQEHRGTIEISSEPGQGTRVRITLPAGGRGAGDDPSPGGPP
jgi:two-component system, LuxR family, sensor kinase FixL